LEVEIQVPLNKLLKMEPSSIRISSIDVFRALTMLLMIFVNDLWTLSGVPRWLEHADTYQDFLGLADVVFPAFLFVMGMAIPLAVRNRLGKGESIPLIIKHIVIRSIALLIMGLFTVNLGSMNIEATGMRVEWFEIIMVLAFFLTWNVYPKSNGWKKYLFNGLQIVGLLIILWLAIIYRSGGEGSRPLGWMQPKWWGILGLIGWAYFGAAIIYLFTRKKPAYLLLAWFLFTLLTIAGHAGWLHQLCPQCPQEWIPGNGAFHSFAIAGIICTLMLEKYSKSGETWKLFCFVISVSLLMLVLAIISRQYFIISKNLASPPWIFFCLSISFAFFGLIYWLVDKKGKERWFNIIKPAGTATLTCYLIPYIVYSLRDIYMIALPDGMKVGFIGIMKSIVFSLLIIGITALLGKLRIKLKI
jgi:heparan-alpha-glucosaminide N-acetyltransferase